LVARNFSPAARQGRLHCSVEDSAIGRVLGQGCTDIETLMLRRPIDRLANANVAGMPTAAASAVFARTIIFDICILAQKSTLKYSTPIYYTAVHRGLTLIQIIFVPRNVVI